MFNDNMLFHHSIDKQIKGTGRGSKVHESHILIKGTIHKKTNCNE